jgi:hypothetical protein
MMEGKIKGRFVDWSEETRTTSKPLAFALSANGLTSLLVVCRRGKKLQILGTNFGAKFWILVLRAFSFTRSSATAQVDHNPLPNH